VPAKPAVEVPLLKLIADVVDGDVLRAFRPPRLVGDDDTSHVLVIQLDEGTLHERHDRRVIAVVRDRHLEVRPRGLTVGFGCRSMLWPILVDLFRSHSLKSARDTPLHPSRGR